MSADRVLVAFASQTGSTAEIARVIAAVLEDAGLPVDWRPVAEVDDVTPYGAVVVGSGVYLARRHADGGGFLERHADDLARRAVWLFSSGPITSRWLRGEVDGTADADEPAVVRVARSVGARGAATFGAMSTADAGTDVSGMPPVDMDRVRSWARSIAGELGAGVGSASSAR